jgi:hypothetical protein
MLKIKCEVLIMCLTAPSVSLCHHMKTTRASLSKPLSHLLHSQSSCPLISQNLLSSHTCNTISINTACLRRRLCFFLYMRFFVFVLWIYHFGVFWVFFLYVSASIFLHLCVYTIFFLWFWDICKFIWEIFWICLIVFSWPVFFPSSSMKSGWDYHNIILFFNDKESTFCCCFRKPPTRKIRGRERQLGLLQCKES